MGPCGDGWVNCPFSTRQRAEGVGDSRALGGRNAGYPGNTHLSVPGADTCTGAFGRKPQDQ